jgi:hypothetical protein
VHDGRGPVRLRCVCGKPLDWVDVEHPPAWGTAAVAAEPRTASAAAGRQFGRVPEARRRTGSAEGPGATSRWRWYCRRCRQSHTVRGDKLAVAALAALDGGRSEILIGADL